MLFCSIYMYQSLFQDIITGSYSDVCELYTKRPAANRPIAKRPAVK